MGKLVIGLARILPLCALVLALPVIAAAQGVTLQPNQGPVGTGVTATGKGWPANASVNAFFNLDPKPINASPVTVDSQGNFTLKFCVPNLAPGNYPTFFTINQPGLSSGPIFMITPGSPGNCQTSDTSILLEQALTYKGEGDFVEQTQFAPGEAIRYGVFVNNTGSSAVTAKIAFQGTGPREIFAWSGDATIPPGRSGFYSPGSIPTDAPAGTYTNRVTITVSDHGVNSLKINELIS